MRTETRRVGFYVAIATLVAFSAWSIHLVTSITELRTSVDARVNWLAGIQQLQTRADGFLARPPAKASEVASEVVRLSAYGLEVFSQMDHEWRVEMGEDETIRGLLGQIRSLRGHAVHGFESRERLLAGPADLAGRLHDVATLIRADRARLSHQLGEAVSLLNLLVFGALALAGAACVLLVLLRRRTESLAASEQRFSLAAAGARDGIWDWDLRRNRVHYSARWRELLDLSPDRRMEHLDDWIERIHVEDRAAFAAAIEAHLGGRTPFLEHEHRLLTQEGQVLWVLARGLVVRDAAGAAVRVAGSLTDITLRRQAAARTEKAELIERATREVGIGVALHGANETLHRVSPALADMVAAWSSADAWWTEVQRFGWLPAAIECHGCPDPAFRGTMQAALPDPTGERRLFEITWAGHAHDVAEAPRTHMLLIQDVTGKAVASHQVAEAEHAYQLAARATNDALFEWNVVDNTLALAPRWREMIGLDEESDGGDDSPGVWLSRVHADDLRRLQDDIGAHLDGHTNRLENLHRVGTADGSYRWLSVHAVAVRDTDNVVQRIVGSFRDVTDIRASEAELRKSASRDGLTGVLNRGAFCAAITEALEEARATGVFDFAVLGIDLDGIGLINDTLGSMQGDRVLRAAGHRLRSVAREGETIGRIGGDEFGMLVHGIEDKKNLDHVFERVQKPLSAALQLEDQEIYPTGSVGLALGHQSYCSGQDILRDAETAMRRAAKRGLASRDVYQRRVRTAARKTLRLNADLRRALERRELVVHYQPLVPLAGAAAHHAIGFEALVRWKHPEFGLVSPGAFIPLAEETGLIVPIGLWVIQEVCRQLVQWNEQFPVGVSCSVNLSARQLQEEDLAGRIAATIQQTGVDPSRIHLEITESVVMERPERAVHTLETLKALGVSLSIDDFGTGYSSLSYLQRFPIDILKIDRSFISGDGGGDCNQIVTSIIELAHNLGLAVVAEGVETEQQLATLAEQGCDIVQGYLFSRPVAAPSATAILEEWDERFSDLAGAARPPKLRVLS